MGPGDAWPQIRAQMISADILIISTPTWMGQQSSVCQRVLERLDAELPETGDNGQPLVARKVAIAAVVGNEDGAHHISGIVFQSLNDVGFSIPAQGSPTGTPRPCTQRTTKTSTRPLKPPHRPLRQPRPTRPIWPGCSAARTIRRSNHRRTPEEPGMTQAKLVHEVSAAVA